MTVDMTECTYNRADISEHASCMTEKDSHEKFKKVKDLYLLSNLHYLFARVTARLDNRSYPTETSHPCHSSMSPIANDEMRAVQAMLIYSIRPRTVDRDTMKKKKKTESDIPE